MPRAYYYHAFHRESACGSVPAEILSMAMELQYDGWEMLDASRWKFLVSTAAGPFRGLHRLPDNPAPMFVRGLAICWTMDFTRAPSKTASHGVRSSRSWKASCCQLIVSFKTSTYLQVTTR